MSTPIEVTSGTSGDLPAVLLQVEGAEGVLMSSESARELAVTLIEAAFSAERDAGER